MHVAQVGSRYDRRRSYPCEPFTRLALVAALSGTRARASGSARTQHHADRGPRHQGRPSHAHRAAHRLHGDPRRRRRRRGRRVAARRRAGHARNRPARSRRTWSTRSTPWCSSGGSAFGLDAATGTVRWLEEHNIGWDVRIAKVPIVPAAILFDLPVGGNPEDPPHRRLRLPRRGSGVDRAGAGRHDRRRRRRDGRQDRRRRPLDEGRRSAATASRCPTA